MVVEVGRHHLELSCKLKENDAWFVDVENCSKLIIVNLFYLSVFGKILLH